MPIDIIFVSKLLSLPRGTTCHEGTLWLRTGSVPSWQVLLYLVYAVIFKFQSKVFVGDFVEGFTEIEDDDICLFALI